MCPSKNCYSTTFKVLSATTIKCVKCGVTDKGHESAVKGWRTRRKASKSALQRTKTRRPSKSINLAHAVIFGLLLGVLSIPFTSTSVTYAKEPDHIVEANEMVLTPEQNYQVLEDIKTKAFEIKKQLEFHQRFETADEVRNYVLAEAKKAGVHVAKVAYIAENESQFNPKATGDMDVTCPSTGKPVRSRGLFQISSCYHPEISDAQAYDVEFATSWAIGVNANSKKDCISQFSTCRAWHKMKGTL